MLARKKPVKNTNDANQDRLILKSDQAAAKHTVKYQAYFKNMLYL
jgi:hypothetical protein